MEAVHIYLDESGDLGWKFDAPYRNGGSSRYLTISSLVVNSDKKYLPKRLIQKLYKKYNWNPSQEKKWADMNRAQRMSFAQKARILIDNHSDDIRYISITVMKENVQNHIRDDGNKLYNYMIACSLTDEMSKHKQVTFIPDPRSIKVDSGNSLHDYLGIKLAFEKQVDTQLRTLPADSASNKNVQFADMLSGIAQGHYEDGKSDPWNEIKGSVNFSTLFFS